MRVIAGMHKGRTLKAPKGRATRPTTDRVRESIFSTLASARGGFAGAVVLDAFAGSGALGIEAASRGAHFVCFAERDRGALEVLRANTSWLDPACYTVLAGNVAARIATWDGDSFDLLLLDPPYDAGPALVAQLLQCLESADALAPDALAVWEHAASGAFEAGQGPFGVQWALASSRQFGDTVVDVFRRDAP